MGLCTGPLECNPEKYSQTRGLFKFTASTDVSFLLPEKGPVQKLDPEIIYQVTYIGNGSVNIWGGIFWGMKFF